MKNNWFYLLLCFSLLTVSSCKKPEFGKDGTDNTVGNLLLTIDFNTDDFPGKTIPFEGASVTITNKMTNKGLTAVANEVGIIQFENLTPGDYSINAAKTFTAAQMSTVLDSIINVDFSFNAALDNVSIKETQGITLNMKGAKNSVWVFKQIYYAGSNITTGASFLDVFVEIYNNSDQVLYADSLCFAQVYGKLNNEANSYTQANHQFDWTQSLGMSNSKANDDYIYAKAIYRIPSNASGNRYPVQSRTSLIIAATGINHKEPYSTNAGTMQEIVNPEATIDLSQADFEVYLVPYILAQDSSSIAFKWDLENPAVTNIEVLYNVQQKEMVLDALGREAYVLFKENSPVTGLPKFATPEVRDLVQDTKYYVQVPILWVYDGVELQHPVSSQRVPKRLPTTIDAGRTNVSGGQYSGQSLIRKTAKVMPDGRKVLMDTDNSQVDFAHLEKANPHKGAASFFD